MTLVRIIKTWDSPNILRQTPGGSGIWNGIKFTTGSVDEADYVITLTSGNGPTTVFCPPKQVWAVMIEPPDEDHRHLHKGDSSFYRIYTQDEALRGRRYVLSHSPLPWFVNKNYDELNSCAIPSKTRSLSWITSTKTTTLGHRNRMLFLEKVRTAVSCDFYGKGLSPIDDKWEGLAPYRYSIAVENFSNPYYWTEKIADCFLSWTMPIYYGCSRITEFFPPESMICIDINSPDAIQKIQDVIRSNLWEQRIEAIAEARRRILDHYQLFPFLAQEIKRFEQQEPTGFKKKIVTIGSDPLYLPWHIRVRHAIGRKIRGRLACDKRK